MSVRRRGDKWVCQIFSRVEGKKVWIGTFETKGEAREAEAEAWKDQRRYRGRRRETVESFAGRWMDDYPRTRESTTKGHRYWATRVAKDFKGRPMNDVDRVEARAYALKNRAVLHSIRAMFSDAVRDGLCDENPFVNLKLEGSRGRRDLVVPTEEELGEMILLAGKLHGRWGKNVLGPFMQLGAYSGLRPGELYGLWRTDFDLEGQTLHVQRQFNQSLRKFTDPKTAASKAKIFLTPQAREALEQVPQLRREVFSAPRGGVLSGSVMSPYWKPIMNSLRRPEFTPHCLRHFYGTHLERLGLSAPDIARQLRHDDGGMTALRLYIHRDQHESNERTAEAFQQKVRPLRAVSGD